MQTAGIVAHQFGQDRWKGREYPSRRDNRGNHQCVVVRTDKIPCGENQRIEKTEADRKPWYFSSRRLRHSTLRPKGPTG